MRCIVLLMAAMMVFGCGKKSAERATEKMLEMSIKENGGENAKVDINDNGISIETEDGAMKMSSGEAAKIPASFPKDVLIYKGAKLQMAMELPQGLNLMFESQDTVQKVSDAYLSAMTSEGWTKEMAMDMGEQKMLAFKKDNRVANVVISSSDGVTQVALTVATQE